MAIRIGHLNVACFEVTISAHRSVELTEKLLLSMGGWQAYKEARALHAAGRRHDATVNDALLTAVGGALRTLLEGRGEHVETFRIAVMVAGSASVPSGTSGSTNETSSPSSC